MIINSPNQALPGITISREGPPRRHIDQDLSSVNALSIKFYLALIFCSLLFLALVISCLYLDEDR